MDIISLRKSHRFLERFIQYFASHWHNEAVYRDCMTACLTTDSPLPQWYLLVDREKIVGGYGLISNDFNARQDLCPYLAALYIEEPYRGHAYGAMLLEHARRECSVLGFKTLHLVTDLTGYYEKYDFQFVGMTSDPFGGTSRIYAAPALCGWSEMLAAAKGKQSRRNVSALIEAGGVAAAILTDKGSLYTGVCIDTACSLGMCAERNAAANMLTNGERRIVKLLALMPDGSVGSPCGACRELLMQLDPENANMEILRSWPEVNTVTLNELLPDWWAANATDAVKCSQSNN